MRPGQKKRGRLRAKPSAEQSSRSSTGTVYHRLMSYNVAILIPPVPADDDEAWKWVNDSGVVEEEGPRPEVFVRLHDQLTDRHPCMCSVPDDEVDNTVWSDGPLINNFLHRAAVLGMSWSRYEEVLPFLIKTSNDLGLTVFDWGTNTIHRPT